MAVRIPATIQGMPVTDISPAAFRTGEHGNTPWGFEWGTPMRITSVVYPEGITEIPERMFSGNTDNEGRLMDDDRGGLIGAFTTLTSVTLPNTLTHIGEGAFAGSALRSITIPNSVISIGTRAFVECKDLTSVTLGNGITQIGNRVFSLTGLTSIVIPNSVTSIEEFAFSSSNLRSLTIPSSVTTIGGSAFLGTSLTSIVIPEGVTRIEGLAFYDCKSLTSVTLPSTIRFIGGGAFANCAITSLTIPDNVENLTFSSDTGRYIIIDGFRTSSLPVFDGNSRLPLAVQARLRQLGYN